MATAAHAGAMEAVAGQAPAQHESVASRSQKDSPVFVAVVNVSKTVTPDSYRICQLQFIYRHFYLRGFGSLKNAAGLTIGRIRMPILKISTVGSSSADFQCAAPEVTILLPLNLSAVEVSGAGSADSAVPLALLVTPVRGDAACNPDAPPTTPGTTLEGAAGAAAAEAEAAGAPESAESIATRRVEIRFASGHEGNACVPVGAWNRSVAQIAAAFQKWYTFVRASREDGVSIHAPPSHSGGQPGALHPSAAAAAGASSADLDAKLKEQAGADGDDRASVASSHHTAGRGRGRGRGGGGGGSRIGPDRSRLINSIVTSAPIPEQEEEEATADDEARSVAASTNIGSSSSPRRRDLTLRALATAGCGAAASTSPLPSPRNVVVVNPRIYTGSGTSVSGGSSRHRYNNQQQHHHPHFHSTAGQSPTYWPPTTGFTPHHGWNHAQTQGGDAPAPAQPSVRATGVSARYGGYSAPSSPSAAGGGTVDRLARHHHDRHHYQQQQQQQWQGSYYADRPFSGREHFDHVEPRQHHLHRDGDRDDRASYRPRRDDGDDYNRDYHRQRDEGRWEQGRGEGHFRTDGDNNDHRTRRFDQRQYEPTAAAASDVDRSPRAGFSDRVRSHNHHHRQQEHGQPSSSDRQAATASAEAPAAAAAVVPAPSAHGSMPMMPMMMSNGQPSPAAAAAMAAAFSASMAAAMGLSVSPTSSGTCTTPVSPTGATASWPMLQFPVASAASPQMVLPQQQQQQQQQMAAGFNFVPMAGMPMVQVAVPAFQYQFQQQHQQQQQQIFNTAAGAAGWMKQLNAAAASAPTAQQLMPMQQPSQSPSSGAAGAGSIGRFYVTGPGGQLMMISPPSPALAAQLQRAGMGIAMQQQQQQPQPAQQHGAAPPYYGQYHIQVPAYGYNYQQLQQQQQQPLQESSGATPNTPNTGESVAPPSTGSWERQIVAAAAGGTNDTAAAGADPA